MKKRFFALVVFLAVALLTIAIVSIARSSSRIDENGKEVGIEGFQEEAVPGKVLTQEEKIMLLEQEKYGVTTSMPDANSSGAYPTLSPEDAAMFEEQQKEAERRAEEIVNDYNDAFKILAKYGKIKTPETISSLNEINRDMLSVFVSALKKYDMTDAEEYLVKKCIAHKYLIVTGSDPLYDEIMDLLS